jgi:hypothetical protein
VLVIVGGERACSYLRLSHFLFLVFILVAKFSPDINNGTQRRVGESLLEKEVIDLDDDSMSHWSFFSGTSILKIRTSLATEQQSNEAERSFGSSSDSQYHLVE